ncbi:MAG: exodeoxyribonuclease VII small subunit [Oscillospiraceae bacterium]|nr:exodeoxyribonuclease VII small subunit [Oscillospiraceae bacterium]
MEKTFEENMARLEAIVERLEKGEAKLGESMALFEEGTGLIRLCRQELDRAEQQVVKLMKGADGAPVETDFLTED